MQIKIIHMAPLGTGGITNLTVGINGFIDPKKIRFDYLVFRNRTEFMEEKALSYGGQKKVVDLENVRIPILRFIKKMYGMTTLFKKERYDVVHVDASTPYDVIVAVAAKIAGVPVIIMHSHNDSFKKGKSLKDYIMPVFKILMIKCCTDYIAISKPAARFMFPKKILEQKAYRIVKNAINAEKFEYSDLIRKEVRKNLGIPDDCFVLGNVGRFVYQKNHDFMIAVFNELHKLDQNAKLLLVGEGPLELEIREKIDSFGLSDSVIFYGITQNVNEPLNAMDAFVFPSRFEGLGMVAVEAQTNGLLVWCAETITEEAKICDNFQYIEGWDAVQWAQIINRNKAYSRSSKIDAAKQAGYDLKSMAAEMECFYCRKVSGNVNTL